MRVLKHRREIDGLRAVAVSLVILFHARLGFTGGFVGVDVFFVISGYLITSLILNDLESFSFVTFWERRVRRIMPAATVMTIACVIAGWFVLFPSDYERFARSLSAQALFFANFHFWRDTNYFALGEVRPLLHVWSLAIEEQFYFCLPIALYALRRVSRRTLIGCLAGAAFLSLGVSELGVAYHPPAAFYLLPSRAWELLVGSIIAALPTPLGRSRWLLEGLSGLGLAAVLVTGSYYDWGTKFPGLAALLPCLGTGAIIVGTSASPTLVGRLLSLRPFTWIGAMSYSLYLWHWPLLTFVHYRFSALSDAQVAWLLAPTLVVAWLSWRLVEQPIRSRTVLGGRRPLFAAAAIATAAFVTAGTAVVRARGVSSRWSSTTLRYAEGKLDFDFRNEVSLRSLRRGELVRLGVQDTTVPITLLVWGDSHAMAILHAVDLICRGRGARCLAVTHSATPPLLDFPVENPFSLGADASTFARAVVESVKEHHVARVLLVAAWAKYLGRAADFETTLGRTVDALRTAGAEVTILKDVPSADFDVPLTLAFTELARKNAETLGVPLDEHVASNRQVNRIIDALVGSSVGTLDPTPVFSDGVRLCRVARDGFPLYFDHHHLSTHGSMELRPLLERVLE